MRKQMTRRNRGKADVLKWKKRKRETERSEGEKEASHGTEWHLLPFVGEALKAENSELISQCSQRGPHRVPEIVVMDPGIAQTARELTNRGP